MAQNNYENITFSSSNRRDGEKGVEGKQSGRGERKSKRKGGERETILKSTN